MVAGWRRRRSTAWPRPADAPMLLEALTFRLGYNATLVTLGAMLLGGAAGVTGTFLFLRKRALVSDAIAHATLPGVGLAFIVMSLLGLNARSLPGLLAGSAVTALLGLLAVQALVSRTRLSEDAAIGAVLSVFFGFGIVLLTVIQTMATGGQAGLEGFLLGSTAGMLFSDALLIAAGGLVVLALVILLRRPMTMVAFDPGFAATTGVRLNRIDVAMMGLVMAVVVVGLKVVGLILVVALLIIPPVTARFWTDRSEQVVLGAGITGALAGWIGAALSASAPDVPTGPIIVLVAFAMFAVSFALAPSRGLVSAWFRHRRFQTGVHVRQGLLALAQGQPIYEPLTLRLLMQRGLARADGVATETGAARAAKALRDERRWDIARATPEFELAAARYDGLTRIEDVLTPDQIAGIDARIGGPKGVGA